MGGMDDELGRRVAEIGRIIDPPSTAALYAPLHAPAPAGVSVTRDQSYGPHGAANLLDVFSSDQEGSRPVLLFVPGGPGARIEPVPHGQAFYDNVMLWAVAQGMVGVNMQRRPDFFPWDVGARDVAAAIGWVKAEIARFGGDPGRIFAWGHSMGAVCLSAYLSHPDLHPAAGVGLKGAVLMAGPYNLAPLTLSAPPMQLRLEPGGPIIGIDVLAGGAAPPPGDPALPENGAILPGLKALDLPLFINVASLDPESLVESTRLLMRELTLAGRTPAYAEFEGHGHMSAVFAVNTADTSTSAPVLDFIRSVH